MRRSIASGVAATIAFASIIELAIFNAIARPITVASCVPRGPTGCTVPALLMSRAVLQPSRNRRNTSPASHAATAAESDRSSSHCSCVSGKRFPSSVLLALAMPNTGIFRERRSSHMAAPKPRVCPVRMAFMVDSRRQISIEEIVNLAAGIYSLERSCSGARLRS